MHQCSVSLMPCPERILDQFHAAHRAYQRWIPLSKQRRQVSFVQPKKSLSDVCVRFTRDEDKLKLHKHLQAKALPAGANSNQPSFKTKIAPINCRDREKSTLALSEGSSNWLALPESVSDLVEIPTTRGCCHRVLEGRMDNTSGLFRIAMSDVDSFEGACVGDLHSVSDAPASDSDEDVPFEVLYTHVWSYVKPAAISVKRTSARSPPDASGFP